MHGYYSNTFVRTFVTFTKHYEIANGTFVVLLWYNTKVQIKYLFIYDSVIIFHIIVLVIIPQCYEGIIRR